MFTIEATVIGAVFGSLLGVIVILIWHSFWYNRQKKPDKLPYEIEKLCSIAHFLINDYGRIMACNARAQQLFKQKAETLIGMNIKQLLRLNSNLHTLLKELGHDQQESFASLRFSDGKASDKEAAKIVIRKISFQQTALYIVYLYPLEISRESAEAINENRQLKRVMHQAPVGMLELRPDYSVRYCNLAMLSFFKVSSFEEVLERKLDQFTERIWLPLQPIVEQAIQSRNGLADGTLDQSEAKHIKKYHVQVKVLFDKNHKPTTIIGIFQSISHWYQQEQLLLSLNNYFKQYFDLLDKNIYLIETDNTFSITFISQGLCKKIGSMDWEWIGYPLFSLFNDRQQNQQQKSLLRQVLSGQRAQFIVKKRLIKKNKSRALWLQLELLPKYDQHQQIQGISIIAQDITPQKKVELLSQIDPMTKLFNRRLFYKKIEQLSKNRNKTTFTLCLLDIDFFKLYNDTYGHPAGDRAIVAVATVLRRQVKKAHGMAFRLGGEEFAILLISENYQSHIFILQETLRCVENLAIPHEKNKASTFLTISMGAQWYDWQQPKRLEDLYDDTDQALYHAKTTGRNRLVLFPFS